MVSAFWEFHKQSWPTLSQDTCLFFRRCIIILFFACRFVISLEIIFLLVIEMKVHFFPLYGYPIFLILVFWRDISFPSWMIWHLCQIIWSYMWVYFWILFSFFDPYVFWGEVRYHSLDYFGSIVILKSIRYSHASYCVLF